MKRGDICKIKYDHHFYSNAIYIAEKTFLMLGKFNDVFRIEPDAVLDVYFNIPDKTDLEYEYILQNFIRPFEPLID